MDINLAMDEYIAELSEYVEQYTVYINDRQPIPNAEDIITNNLYTINTTFDANKLKSALTSLCWYIKNKDETFVPTFGNELLEKCYILANYETIVTFKYINEPPIYIISKSPIYDNVDALIDIWIYKKWPLHEKLLNIFNKSENAYKFIQQAIELSKFPKYDSSKSCIHVFASNKILIDLLSQNKNSLEFVFAVDKNIEKTFRAINGYNLWLQLLKNESSILINTAIDNFHLVKFNLFTDKKSMMRWMTPLIINHPCIEYYIFTEDFISGYIGTPGYRSKHLISSIYEMFEVSDGEIDVQTKCLRGMFEIVKYESNYFKLKAIDTIINMYQIAPEEIFETLTIDEIAKVCGASVEAFLYIFEDESEWYLRNYELTIYEIIDKIDRLPYFDEFGDLCNLDYFNVEMLDVDNIEISEYINGNFVTNINSITMNQWGILSRSNFGYDLLRENFEFIENRMEVLNLFINNEQICIAKILYLIFDDNVVGYVTDDTYYILVARVDFINKISYKPLKKMNQDLYKELLCTWYNPDRINQVLNTYCPEINLREYLEWVSA